MKYKMNKRWKTMLIACFSICFSVNNIFAQAVWENMVEQLLIHDENSTQQWDNLMEDLTELKENPIPINLATKKQLERFPFLSDQLIENILYYLYKNGPIISDKELMMVENMDIQTARCLKLFITFQLPEKEENKPTLKNILKYGKQELSTRVDIPFYTRAGYQSYTSDFILENPNKRYLGYAFYHNMRYSFRYSDKVYVGLTAEKDAGEPFFAGNNKKGYDYYSPYLLIKNIGKFQALALGNYKLNYGYGLVMNNDFSLGKTAMLSTLENKARGIKKHSSTDEYNYFQGIAASYHLTNRWTSDVFYSYRSMDGNIDNRFITSLKEDGYHRIPRDFEKKNNVYNHLIGSNIHYNGKNIETGLTAVYNVFNKVLNPSIRPYNKFYSRGKDFFNMGVNYKFFWRQLVLLGETALDKRGRLATLNMLRYSPKGSFQLVVMNRFYDVAYQSIYARSIGEGSLVQNESGLYIGLETNILKSFKLSTYGDFFYFPWKKYQMTKNGTTGFDGIIQINYSPSYELDMFIKYRYKNKYKDFTPDDGEKTTIPYIQQKWKYQVSYSPMDKLLLKTVIDMVHNAYQQQDPSKGILISQSIGYKFKKFPLQLDTSAAWFYTDDYASRISIYEKGLLYSFSVPSFYGQGERFTMNARYELNEHLIFQAKYALTHYRDRNVIGSDLEQINGNMKNDLYLQLRLKF
ncbi:MAG: helix-hairpin-helix domain-containing protein [Bacteroides sp.]|nr:helix-hairpin-helix domain-containing protein [Bacteroides sp.]